MINKIFPILFILLSTEAVIYSQDGNIEGKPVAEIFTDFHYSLGGDTAETTGFGLNRAYFGYNYFFFGNYYASLIVDIGSPQELGPGSRARRYAHFREASLGYADEKLSVSIGITSTTIFRYQQRFWGKRYIAKPYQAINGYGYVADLGIMAEYKFSNWLQADISLMNGKGHSDIQPDKSMKGSLGFTLTAHENTSFRIYYDLMKRENLWQNTLVGFAGYRNDLFYIGAEVSFKSNLDLKDGHHAWGVSSTGGIELTEKLELFTRYDYSTSAVPAGEPVEWNYQRDGSFIITGLQYTVNKYIKAALDYQAFMPFDNSRENIRYIYLNWLAKF